MIKPTDEMLRAMVYGGSVRERLAAILRAVDQCCLAFGPDGVRCERALGHDHGHGFVGDEKAVTW